MEKTIDHPADVQNLLSQLDAAEHEAERLVAALSEEQGTRRSTPHSWSIAECLDHVATANRVYLQAMRPAAERARTAGRIRSSAVEPGLGGRLFIWTQEPPAKRWLRMKAPRAIRPRPSPPLADAFAAFVAAQNEVRTFINQYADLDLGSTRFRNPFIPIIHFSLATGLHVITAHERRHLWQAWNVRRAVERIP